MCVACFTAVEAIAINSGGGVAMLKGVVDRVRDHLAGRPPIERHQANWDANATFLRELDIDPAVTLGPRPGFELDLLLGCPSSADVAIG